MAPVLFSAAVKLFWELIKAIPKIVASLAKTLPSVLKTIQNVLKGIPQILWSILSAALGKVASWGSSLVAKGKEAVQKLVKTVVDKVKELPNKMKEAGKNLVQGLWKGISNSYTWIKNKIKNWVGNVTKFIKKLFGIASPSKETAWMGKMLSEGLAVGIEAEENTPLKAMRRLSEGMLDEADNLNGVTLERRLNHAFTAPNVSSIETGMLDKLDKILAAIERGQILTIDGKTLIGSTVGGYDAAMGQRRALAARGAL
jgi:phage-related protein